MKVLAERARRMFGPIELPADPASRFRRASFGQVTIVSVPTVPGCAAIVMAATI
jgi:hypothetical protein